MGPGSDEPSTHGAGPYRTAPLAAEPRPSRWRRALPPIVAGALLGTMGAHLAARASLPRRVARPAGDAAGPGAPVEHATSLAAGEGVVYVVTRGASGEREVLTFPGHAVRRGTDVIAAPRAHRAPGASRVTLGGLLVGEGDRYYDLNPGGDVTGLDLPTDGAHGSAAEVVPYARGSGLPVIARMGDGALRYLVGGPWDPLGERRWADVAATPTFARRVVGQRQHVCAILVDGHVRCWDRLAWSAYDDIRVDDAARSAGEDVPSLALPDIEEVVLSPPPSERSTLACARGRRGAVACAWLYHSQPPDSPSWLFATPVPLTGAVPAARVVAPGTHDLCVVGFDGAAHCVRGPDEDAPAELPPGELTLRRARSLDGAAEIALARGLGCARWPSGVVRCWGAFARGGAVIEREAPTLVEGLDAAERLVAGDGAWCAVQRGSLECRGARRGLDASGTFDGARDADGRPWREAAGPAVTSAAFRGAMCGTGPGLCVTRRDGAVECGDGPCFAWSPASLRLRRVATADLRVCVLDEGERAWCSEGGGFARAPAFDGYEGLAALGDHVCAWGRGPLRCVRSTRAPQEAPARSPFEGLRGVVSALGDDCVLLREGSIRCLAADGRMTAEELPPTLLAALGGAVSTGAGWSDDFCVAGANGRVACTARTAPPHGAPVLVPGVDRAVEIVHAGVRCARRSDGRVLCWGSNVGNTLTAAEAARSPRLVPLRR